MRLISAALISMIGLFVAASAFAADLPVKSAHTVPALPSAYNWTGWYVGLNAGGNWGRSHPSTTAQLSGAFAICPGCLDDIASAGGHAFKTDGFTGGVFGGYNYQYGTFVIGGELDFEYFRSVGSTAQTIASASCPCNMTITSSISTDWLFTARPRVGFTAGHWLFYGTGGVAVTKLKGNWAYADDFAGGLGPGSESASASSVKAGWTAGGGFETALPNNWTIGAEYLHVDFGSLSAMSTNFAPTAAAGTLFNHRAQLQSDIVRARTSMRF